MKKKAKSGSDRSYIWETSICQYINFESHRNININDTRHFKKNKFVAQKLLTYKKPEISLLPKGKKTHCTYSL